MKRFFEGWPLIAVCACLQSSIGVAAARPELRLQRVVMLMRHGIRPPTTVQPIPAKYSQMPWPKWNVGPGLLTGHGAKGITLLAASDRAYFVHAGFLPASGCPAPGQVSVLSSNVTRAVQTATSWSKTLLPGCDLNIQHPAPGNPDPLFHILETQPAWFDGHRAYEAALNQSPKGGLAAQTKDLAPQMHRLESVLGCARPKCDLEKDPTRLVEKPHGRPDLDGPLGVASTASESFLLEYLEGMPMNNVGWGRLTRNGIEQMLVFNSIKFKYVDRPPFIARAAAGQLARTIVTALSAPAGSRITLLAGHDTNIADLGGLLRLHWHVAGYPADAIPPGSALGFELLSDSKGHQFVRAFFRSQTMEQLRNLEPLSAANPPYREILRIPGCAMAAGDRGCDLPRFIRLVESRLR